ncbi:MAG: hypothetical protein JWR01_1280 [Subtercola sp.]|nr:hypothetical protein [Subtercola sp.]
MTDLEARLRRLEDRVAIADLSTRYFLASDFDDYEAIKNAFVENGKFSADGFESGSTNQEISDGIRSARSNFGKRTIHTPHYSLVEFVDDDHATGLVGAHLEISVGGTSVYGAVRYEDAYVRDGEVWKFTSRSMRTIFALPWAEVGESLTSSTPVRWPGGGASPSGYPDRPEGQVTR